MDWLVGFVSFSLAMGLTPGPNNMLLMTTAADVGFARAVPAIAGVVLGFALMAAILGALTAFTVPGEDTVRQGLLMALLYLPLGTLSTTSWAAGGAAIGTRLGDGPRLRWFNRIMAVLLVASLVPVWL